MYEDIVVIYQNKYIWNQNMSAAEGCDPCWLTRCFIHTKAIIVASTLSIRIVHNVRWAAAHANQSKQPCRTQNLRSVQQDLVHPLRNLHLLHPFGYSFVLKVGVRTLPFTVTGSRGRWPDLITATGRTGAALAFPLAAGLGEAFALGALLVLPLALAVAFAFAFDFGLGPLSSFLFCVASATICACSCADTTGRSFMGSEVTAGNCSTVRCWGVATCWTVALGTSAAGSDGAAADGAAAVDATAVSAGSVWSVNASGCFFWPRLLGLKRWRPGSSAPWPCPVMHCMNICCCCIIMFMSMPCTPPAAPDPDAIARSGNLFLASLLLWCLRGPRGLKSSGPTLTRAGGSAWSQPLASSSCGKSWGSTGYCKRCTAGLGATFFLFFKAFL